MVDTKQGIQPAVMADENEDDYSSMEKNYN